MYFAVTGIAIWGKDSFKTDNYVLWHQLMSSTNTNSSTSSLMANIQELQLWQDNFY